MKTKSHLKEVPETMLWTLHNRAVEAMRDDGVIDDDQAVSIYQSIEYDYKKNFGKAEPSHAIRSLGFDREIRRFIADHPNGTIVNLGEGLETQRFRIKDQSNLWLCVDLPESIAIREQFIEPDDRHLHIPVSALDRAWFDAVPQDKPVFITAQGLFMYFTEQDIKLLMQDIDKQFAHWYIMFDTIPNWLSRKTLSEQGWKKTPSYVTPKMPWGINRDKIQTTFKNYFSENVLIQDIGYSSFPRGLQKLFFGLFSALPYFKNRIPSIVKIERHRQ